METGVAFVDWVVFWANRFRTARKRSIIVAESRIHFEALEYSHPDHLNYSAPCVCGLNGIPLWVNDADVPVLHALFKPKLLSRISLHAFGGGPFEVGSMRFTPFGLSHDAREHTSGFQVAPAKIAHAVLRDNKIPFYIDNPVAIALPLENEAVKQFTIHVHQDFAESAQPLLDEHFEKSDGRYQLRYSGARERLLAFSFHAI